MTPLWSRFAAGAPCRRLALLPSHGLAWLGCSRPPSAAPWPPTGAGRHIGAGASLSTAADSCWPRSAGPEPIPCFALLDPRKKKGEHANRNSSLGPDAIALERRIFQIWAYLIPRKFRVLDAKVFFLLFCLYASKLAESCLIHSNSQKIIK